MDTGRYRSPSAVEGQTERDPSAAAGAPELYTHDLALEQILQHRRTAHGSPEKNFKRGNVACAKAKKVADVLGVDRCVGLGMDG